MIRISCNALCRIYHPEHGYLLGLNRNRLAQGKRVLMALGGGMLCTQPRDLESLDIDWETEAEEDGSRELRFVMLADRLDLFRLWFISRKGRETSPLRELREELVEEYGALPDLVEADVTIGEPTLHESRKLSDRSGLKIPRTHYFHEVYDVTFAPPMLEQLYEFTRQHEALCWVTKEQIQEGYWNENTPITTIILHDA